MGRWVNQFPPFVSFLINFSPLSKHTLAVQNRIYIWQVPPQLSCGDTCQTWMWFEESNMYFCKIEDCAYGEINDEALITVIPGWVAHLIQWCFIHIGAVMRLSQYLWSKPWTIRLNWPHECSPRQPNFWVQRWPNVGTKPKPYRCLGYELIMHLVLRWFPEFPVFLPRVGLEKRQFSLTMCSMEIALLQDLFGPSDDMVQCIFKLFRCSCPADIIPFVAFIIPLLCIYGTVSYGPSATMQRGQNTSLSYTTTEYETPVEN